MHLKKLLIGVRPAQRMFRVASLMGNVVDEVLALRGGGNFDDQYYSQVTRNHDHGFVQLVGDKGRNKLRLDQEGLVFSRAIYDAEGIELHADKVVSEFLEVWKRANDVLKIRDIRRIGLIGECRIEVESDDIASRLLMPALTMLEVPENPKKFHLHFEKTAHTKSKVGVPDQNTDDMSNVIIDIYDATADSDFPSNKAINVNFDVQRYYTPLFNGGIAVELQKLKKQMDGERHTLKAELVARGVAK